MWKMPFTLALFAVGGMALAGCSEESKTDYIVCESTYALCTTAPCKPIEEGQDTVFCDCEVKTGYSVGSTPCHDPLRELGARAGRMGLRMYGLPWLC